MEIQNLQTPKQSADNSASFQLGLASGALALLLVLVAAIEYSLPAGSQDAQVAAAAQTMEPRSPRTKLFEGLSLGAKSVYVLDVQTGETLFAKNASTQLPLASITKVALALAVSEVLSPEEVITLPSYVSSGGASALLPGQRIKVKDLLDFTLVASSNSGAQVLADMADERIRGANPNAPLGEGALYRMNALAEELGLSQTYFLNVHGLDESMTQAGAYGSAQDIATLFAYATRAHRDVFENTTQNGILFSDASGSGEAHAQNTNEALGEIPGLIMGKTGFTDLAGGNLGVVFEAEPGHPIAIVVLGSTRDGRFADMKLLVSAAIEALKKDAPGS